MAARDTRTCTCHPDDNPPKPCARKYAYSECSEDGGTMHIQRFLGRQLCFRNGLSVGFSWVHCNGETSKQSAMLAAFHPPRSITWLWSVYWTRPGKVLCLPKITRWKPPGGSTGSTTVTLPLVGSLSLNWQRAMWRDAV